MLRGLGIIAVFVGIYGGLLYVLEKASERQTRLNEAEEIWNELEEEQNGCCGNCNHDADGDCCGGGCCGGCNHDADGDCCGGCCNEEPKNDEE